MLKNLILIFFSLFLFASCTSIVGQLIDQSIIHPNKTVTMKILGKKQFVKYKHFIEEYNKDKDKDRYPEASLIFTNLKSISYKKASIPFQKTFVLGNGDRFHLSIISDKTNDPVRVLFIVKNKIVQSHNVSTVIPSLIQFRY